MLRDRRTRADALRSRVEAAARALRRAGARRAHWPRRRRGRRRGRRDLGYPGRGQAVRRRDRAQDRARARPARPPRRRTRSRAAAAELLAAAAPDDGAVELLVAPMVRGTRELIAGLRTDDPQFGPCVMLGVGGVLAEAVGDVAFRLVPLDRVRRRRDDRRPRDPDAARSVPRRARGRPRRAGRRARSGCRGSPRREPDVVVGRRQPAHRRRRQADRGRRARRARAQSSTRVTRAPALRRARRPPSFAALFEPAGRDRRGRVEPSGQVRLRRAAQHPDARATRARSARPTSRAATVLGVDDGALASTTCPTGRGDLVFVCTPAGANPELLRGVRAAGRRAPRSSRRAGYGEAGEAGGGPSASSSRSPTSSASCSRARTGRASCRRPSRLCAQIVAPYPPRGRIAIASQSGNFVSSFQNCAVADRRRREPGGVARATPRRSPSPTTSTATPTTPRPRSASRTSKASPTGARFFERLRAVAAAQAGRAAEGRRDRGRPARRRVATPARSRPTTGCSTACAARPAITRADDARRGVRGGGDVRDPAAARGAARRGRHDRRRLGRRHRRRDRPRPSSSCWPLPDDLRAAIDEKLPPRWSRNNPIDLAGGETRDTIPEVLELVARHPDVDAIVYLGLGIQSNQARLMRDGPLLSRPRARADRRVPRASGRALRAGGGRDLGRDRQADPHRDRARGRRPRQPRARDRARDAAGSATRRRTARSPRSGTCGATRASADRGGARLSRDAGSSRVAARRSPALRRAVALGGPSDVGTAAAAATSAAAALGDAAVVAAPRARAVRRSSSAPRSSQATLDQAVAPAPTRCVAVDAAERTGGDPDQADTPADPGVDAEAAHRGRRARRARPRHDPRDARRRARAIHRTGPWTDL